MICASCHRENPAGHAFCHACGATLAPLVSDSSSPRMLEGLSVCPRCGAGQSPGDQFCSACGQDLSAPVTKNTHPTRDGGWAGPSVRVATTPHSAYSALCLQCGAPVDGHARFCKFCGAAVQLSSLAMTGSNDESPDVPPIDLNPQAFVVVILRDGTDGGVYPIINERTDVGSREGDIVLKDDPYLSARHARIERRGDSFVLLDLGSVNGIYLRLREPANLADGDMILIGQQVLRFEIPSEAERQVGAATQHGVMIFGTPEQPRLARLTQYTTEGLGRDVYHLHRNETVFGREAADLTFSDDPFLSRRHAAIVLHPHERHFVLRDLGSSNGTALRCRTEHILASGDQFRLGRHLFRFDLGAIAARGGDQGLP
jgi:pSer/pThr/pTyr-binding forkhead associated (FHA) protein